MVDSGPGSVIWNIQAHVFGYGIEDVAWFGMLHVPLAFIIFGAGAVPHRGTLTGHWRDGPTKPYASILQLACPLRGKRPSDDLAE